MGYDMHWVTRDEAEEAAVAEATAKFYAAADARNALDRGSVEYEAAQLTVDDLYGAMRDAEKSYFRCNIWGMGTFRTVMVRLGMVDTAFRNPPFPEEGGWDDETGEPTEATERVLRAFNEFDGRIALSKFGSNDGWVVTPEEIKGALAQYDSFDEPRKAILSALSLDEHNAEGMAEFFAEFVEWMREAAEHDGFRVY